MSKFIRLYDEENKFNNNEIVALSCKWVLFKVIKSKKKKCLTFVSITHEKKPCRCDCCTIGGVGSGCPVIPNNSKNCLQYKQVQRIERKLERK